MPVRSSAEAKGPQPFRHNRSTANNQSAEFSIQKMSAYSQVKRDDEKDVRGARSGMVVETEMVKVGPSA